MSTTEQLRLLPLPPVAGDDLLDALLEVWGIDPAEVTRSAMVDIERCLRDLSAVGTTPDRVRQCRAWFAAGQWRRFKARRS